MDRAKLCERIVFSEHPGREMKLIRKELNIPQKALAKILKVSPQALSRRELVRKSPGVGVVRRFILSISKA